jgi:hypothetical protein
VEGEREVLMADQPAWYKYTDPRQTDPFFGFSTGNDVRSAQQAGLREAGVAAGVGALGTLGQIGLSMIPTAQDHQNDERLGELAAHKGLTQGERADIDEQAMRGVRALATERQARTEGQIAAAGSTDVGALSRARSAAARDVNDAAIKAADIGIQANREQVAADKAEEERRIAYKSEKAQDRLNLAQETLSGLAQQAGPVLARNAAMREPTDEQFLSAQGMVNADGGPAYPGLQGKTVDQMRALWRAQLRGGDAIANPRLSDAATLDRVSPP